MWKWILESPVYDTSFIEGPLDPFCTWGKKLVVIPSSFLTEKKRKLRLGNTNYLKERV
jgi:hypothetical protein